MANHKSALKRIKQTAVKAERNRFYKTRIKNITRAFKEAIESGNKEEAQKSLLIINKNFHKFVTKGILKQNTASRKVSRLHKQVNALN
ncbi:MAG: SSU ribosomal protein S20p [uncultured Campylobacterales bacterium]|uniref:Small ribosomal subunit protein bS20 n=1 Tax=uncultured Campylobacterales bacterium TaxID=352960 RepID=A0A6S6S6T8_9BACT|nr:MAG: SSU ribosomal protein S20p [uncultured Campylobacterales bacterium]